MATSKHVVILLAITLGGILAAGQDKPAASAPSSQHGISNSRVASCIVRISVDPAIMPLSRENIESLLESSGVAYKAGHEVLGFEKEEDFRARGRWVYVEWLNAAPAPMPSARPSRQAGKGSPDEEMMRQMEQIYGRDYMQQMMGSSGEGKKDGSKEARPGESPRKEDASDPSRQDRSDGDPMRKGPPAPSGAAAGGAVGGMGMGGGVFSADEPSMNLSRRPAESEVAYRTRLMQAREQQAKRQAARNRAVGSMGGYGGGTMGAMGGYGGTMGGMGGYGGMMGGMGGYGGTMGGYGGMGFYAVPGSTQQGAGMEQSVTVKLTVGLPDKDLPPRAEEFLQAVVRNLRDSLRQAYESCRTDIEQMLVDAKTQYQFVESRLDSRTGAIPPATTEIRKQLDMQVDLSQLSPQAPLATAIEILRKSVDPPLNIVVLWKDVQTNLSVGPASPSDYEGSPRIRLGTALDLLVKGLYDGHTTAMWRIKDDTIVIGTAATLGLPQGAAGQPMVEADAANLAGQRNELARRIQALELDLAGLDARQKAVQEQIAATQAAAGKQLADDRVTQELEELEHTNAINLENLKKLAGAGRVSAADLAQAEESAARIRIELARRREELSRQAGGGQLEEFTKELSRIAIDKAEKEAQLQIVRKQLDEVQKQLAEALTFDPEAARLRLAREALDITGRRVAELQTRLADLQPPTVLVIGAN
jgi:hypothetical protein